MHSDKVYILMNEIENNNKITQRELSEKTGFSLGSINLLLKKMVRQGLVKIETIPANRVVYLLTPIGMLDKAYKTVRYVKNHYRIINETKKKIKENLNLLHKRYKELYILHPKDELTDLLRTSITEYKHIYPGRSIQLIKSLEEIPVNDQRKQVDSLVLIPEDMEDAEARNSVNTDSMDLYRLF